MLLTQPPPLGIPVEARFHILHHETDFFLTPGEHWHQGIFVSDSTTSSFMIRVLQNSETLESLLGLTQVTPKARHISLRNSERQTVDWNQDPTKRYAKTSHDVYIQVRRLDLPVFVKQFCDSEP